MNHLKTSTCHDCTTGRRITTLRRDDQAVRITEHGDGAPTCVRVPSTGRCTLEALPFALTFDEAVAFWTLRLEGRAAPLATVQRLAALA